MLYIDPDIITEKIPNTWLDSAKNIVEELSKKETFKEKKDYIDSKPIWGELKEVFESLSHNKCWYSDTKNLFSYMQVDHYRPKWRVKDLDWTEREGYWWLAYDYSNYILSWWVWNNRKNDKFYLKDGSFICSCETDNIEEEEPLLLNPTKLSDTLLIYVDKEGFIISKDLENLSDTLRVDKTVEILNLNFKKLQEERKKKINEAERLINKCQNNLSKSQTPVIKAILEENMKELKKLVDPKEELYSIMKVYFQNHPVSWVKSLL